MMNVDGLQSKFGAPNRRRNLLIAAFNLATIAYGLVRRKAMSRVLSSMSMRATSWRYRMRTLTAIAIVLLLCGCSSSTGGGNAQNTSGPNATQATETRPSNGVTSALHDSTVTFKAAQKACVGALGSVTFSLGHVRAHPATGVSLQEKPSATTGVMTMTFTEKATTKAAPVEANGHNRTVTGQNVTTKLNSAVACIGAE